MSSQLEASEQLLDTLRAQQLPGLPVAVVPSSFKLESLRKYELAECPAGTVAVHSLSSLADYVQRFHGSDSAVFASRDERIVFGVLDWHDAASTVTEAAGGWARHRVDYKLAFTPEWLAWTGISGNSIKQEAFAEFVEENLPDIIDPDSATVLEVVRNLSGNRKVKFGSSRNLGNGDMAIVWQEETDAGAGPNQETKVPTELKLRLPVFRGAEKATTFDVKAFLRYRIHSGVLTFEVKLHRPEKAVDLAFEEVASALISELNTRELSAVPLYLGTVAKWPSEILA